MNSKSTYTLVEFIEASQKNPFKIPFYQRGYIWGKQTDKEKDSIHYLLDDLIKVMDDRDVFLQGITTTEDGIDIIDGQQRLTTLYLLLRTLGCDELKIGYDRTRRESEEFLKSADLLNQRQFDEKDLQDIHFFKNALNICSEYKKSFNKGSQKDDYADAILKLKKHVKFLWIKIPRDKAKETFTMMNGHRAKMRDDELIKAELLRQASQKCEGMTSWEGQDLRGRYARAWDQWLQWWNQPQVRAWLRLDDDSMPLRWLLSVVYNDARKTEVALDAKKLDFSKFRTRLLNSVAEAKTTFYKLRIAQKRFEDAFDSPLVYNLIGGVISAFDGDNRQKFIYAYFSPNGLPEVIRPEQLPQMFSKFPKLEDFFLMSFIGMTYDEITNPERNDDGNPFRDKLYKTRRRLFATPNLYREEYETGINYLLMRNIIMDCKQNEQGRKFDFTILGHRSMEHIFPKSKVWHTEGEAIIRGDNIEISRNDVTDDMIERSNIGSLDYKDPELSEKVMIWEHSIGNMALIYKEDNSTFNNSDFSRKRELFFRPDIKDKFRSRNLLHSLLVFAYHTKWDDKDIIDNHQQYQSDYDNMYGIND